MLAEIDKDARDIRLLFLESEKLKTAVQSLRDELITFQVDSMVETKLLVDKKIAELKSENKAMAAEVRELRETVITLRGEMSRLGRSVKLDESNFVLTAN
jgi:hypothetical protein